MKTRKILSWTIRILVALILGQTLFFKFSGAAESVALFRQLGAERSGRWIVGLLELVAVVLLLVPRTVVYGALVTILLMSGALMAHAATLGFSGAMASLAAMALLLLVGGSVLLALHWEELLSLSRRFHGPMGSKPSRPAPRSRQ